MKLKSDSKGFLRVIQKPFLPYRLPEEHRQSDPLSRKLTDKLHQCFNKQWLHCQSVFNFSSRCFCLASALPERNFMKWILLWKCIEKCTSSKVMNKKFLQVDRGERLKRKKVVWWEKYVFRRCLANKTSNALSGTKEKILKSFMLLLEEDWWMFFIKKSLSFCRFLLSNVQPFKKNTMD